MSGYILSRLGFGGSSKEVRSEYAPIKQLEDDSTARTPPGSRTRNSGSRRPLPQRVATVPEEPPLSSSAFALAQLLQWAVLAALLAAGVAVLALRLLARPELLREAFFEPRNRTALSVTQGALSSPFGSSSVSFSWRSRMQASMRQHARAAAKQTVLLIGSTFDLSNTLLAEVFDALCAYPRLGLHCERPWAGTHDLTSLAAGDGYKGRRRIVWLERETGKLSQSLKGLGKYAYGYHCIHVLWDPYSACVAQWHATLHSNLSLGDLCPALGMSSLPALYRRAKRDKARTIQPRLEELVSKKTGPAAWRQLFKFVNLAEKGSDLTTLAMQIVARLELRSVVHNRAAPGWVRAKIEHNATLLAWLRRLQWDLEYTGAGKGALPPMR